MERFGNKPKAVLRRKIIYGLLKEANPQIILDAIVIWESNFGSHEQTIKDLVAYSKLISSKYNNIIGDEDQFAKLIMKGFSAPATYEAYPDLSMEALTLYNATNISVAKDSTSSEKAISQREETYDRSNDEFVYSREHLFQHMISEFLIRFKKEAEQHYYLFLDLISKSSIESKLKNKILDVSKDTKHLFQEDQKELVGAFNKVYNCSLDILGPVKTDRILKDTINKIKNNSYNCDIQIFL